MTRTCPSEVTALLEEFQAGDTTARDRLVERLYRELHDLAVYFLSQEALAQSLQPTALLHEAFLQMFGSNLLTRASNRAYLFAAAAQAMRRTLTDHARRRNAQKRGGGRERLPIDLLLSYYEDQQLDMVDLNEALEQLEKQNDRASQVVTLRFFGGFTVQEVADHLGISITTAESDFRFARAWIRRVWEGKP